MLHQHTAEGIHWIEEASTNCYLVQEDSRLTVVDTRFPRSWDTLQEALPALGRSPADIDAVMLTHGHFDHVICLGPPGAMRTASPSPSIRIPPRG